MRYVYFKGNIVVGITNDSNGLPDYDSMGTFEDFQTINIGDVVEGDVISSNNVKSHCLTKLQFSNRLTLQEHIAIETSTDPIVKVLDKQQQLAEFIDLEDQATQQGIGYLYNVGILTLERMNQILS